MDAHGWVVLTIGFVVSFVVALGVVAWFMRWVRARGFAPFAIYRIALGLVLLILLWRGLIYPATEPQTLRLPETAKKSKKDSSMWRTIPTALFCWLFFLAQSQ